jgi:lipoprotein-anchoring transpeptidase ErfK/SrfK
MHHQGLLMTCRSRTSAASVLSLFITALAVSSASAQTETLYWDWGGEKKVDGTGREVVRLATAQKPGEIIVSFGDRRLYFVTKPGEALSYPIAIPRDQSRWEGKIAVTSKRENPSWTPTPSMRTENPKLPSWVPGGHPMNPLGIRALYLGSSTYRIHGTDAPWTIGSAVSKGCVRMYNQDVLDLYPRVKTGANVLVTWDKFKAVPDGEAKVPPVETLPVEPAAKTAERAQKGRRLETGSLAPGARDYRAAGEDTPVAPRAPSRPKAPAVTEAEPGKKAQPKVKLPEILDI